MRIINWKFTRTSGSWGLALALGLLFSACSEMQTEPVSSSSSDLEAEILQATPNPNLINLEGFITTSFGDEGQIDESSRGLPSAKARFNIELRYITPPTDRQREVFQDAVDRWERIIIGDEPNFTGVDIPSSFPGGGLLVTADQVLDDIIIEVNLTVIDGPGRILGRAGPRFIRLPEATTITGLMEFDVADLAGLDEADLFEEVIIHEMGHVLGIGTLWQRKGLLVIDSFEQAVDPDYLGRFGNLFWKTEGGNGLLPIEGAFFDANGNPFTRPGTSYGHWDEDLLDNELMTGFLNGGVENPLSRITAGSVRDLGYRSANVGERYDLPSQNARTSRMSENGINIAEGEELLLPIGTVTAKKK
ncbi:MAG: hypothetical protein ABJH96_05640 [Algoriphagus sp.]|uniref:hypothetical protein n=1 Tax=Algoriphagus sp. TaxID=1872435 RepID=UPI00329A3702